MEEFSFGGIMESLEDKIAPLFHKDVAFGFLSLDVTLEAKV
jgi:hypothetical protein